RWVRSKVDAEEVVQEVWLAFLCGRYLKETSASVRHLLSLLLAMAKQRVLNTHRRYLHTEKCNVKCECPLDDLPPEAAAVDPRQAEAAADEWDRRFACLPPHLRRAMVRLRERAKLRSAARALDMPERSLQRELACQHQPV